MTIFSTDQNIKFLDIKKKGRIALNYVKTLRETYIHTYTYKELLAFYKEMVIAF